MNDFNESWRDRPQMTAADVSDLRQVNWLAKTAWRDKKNFGYFVKGELLRVYGKFDGYDLHSFTRRSWHDRDEDFSWHEHILARHEIHDAVFHSPTNEFSYSDQDNREKESENFSEYKRLCRGTIDGLIKAPENFDKSESVKALRRLVHKFKSLLRAARPKPARHEFSHFYPRTNSFGKTAYRVRVPPGVAVCLGCGQRLSFLMNEYDCNVMRLDPHSTNWLYLECDTARVQEFFRSCGEFKKQYQGISRTRLPWQAERQTVVSWLIAEFPRFDAWLAAQVEKAQVSEQQNLNFGEKKYV